MVTSLRRLFCPSRPPSEPLEKAFKNLIKLTHQQGLKRWEIGNDS